MVKISNPKLIRNTEKWSKHLKKTGFSSEEAVAQLITSGIDVSQLSNDDSQLFFTDLAEILDVARLGSKHDAQLFFRDLAEKAGFNYRIKFKWMNVWEKIEGDE